jgi:2',3'-cyclic-nucleotide 2'-phosphodiesterase (5'-nucleotidase family)
VRIQGRPQAPGRTPKARKPGRFAVCGLWLAVWALSARAIGPQSPQIGTVLILHTNDIHAHIKSNSEGLGGLAAVKAIIDSVRAERSDVLVVDCGDLIKKGDLMAEASRGEAAFRVFNRLGYDAFCPGNNEFKYDYPALLRNISVCSARVVVSNVVDTSQIWGAVSRGLVASVNGFRIGIVGATVALDSTELTRERGRGALRFEPLVPVLRDELKRLGSGIDLAVALTHIGFEADRALAESLPELDVIVGGHSHTRLDSAVRAGPHRTAIVQAGAYARFVGYLELVLDRRSDSILGVRSGLIAVAETGRRIDTALTQYIRELDRRLAPGSDEVIADAPERLTGFADLGGWTAQAFRDALGCDIGFCSPGTCLEPIYKGRVTREDVFRKSPYPGQLAVFTATGSELRAMLEHVLAADEPGLGIAGLVLRRVAQAEPGRRIVEISLAPERTYRVAADNWVVANAVDFLGREVRAELSTVTVVNAQIHHARKSRVINRPRAAVLTQ